MAPINLSDEQKAGILRYVRYEIVRCPCIENGEQQFSEWWLSHLLHARVLIDFFECKGQGKDDVFCSHFGFPKQSLAVSDWYRQKMNKDLAHLTYTRVGRDLVTQGWKVDEVLGPVRTATRDFVNHIVANPPALAAPEEMAEWKKLSAAFSSASVATDPAVAIVTGPHEK